MLGVLDSAGAAICLAPCGSALAEWNLGQAINAVTGTRLWALSFLFLGTVLIFCFAFFCYAAAATVVRLLLCNLKLALTEHAVRREKTPFGSVLGFF
jgi:hypothetical protein